MRYLLSILLSALLLCGLLAISCKKKEETQAPATTETAPAPAANAPAAPAANAPMAPAGK
jgi:hypothetical protein